MSKKFIELVTVRTLIVFILLWLKKLPKVPFLIPHAPEVFWSKVDWRWSLLIYQNQEQPFSFRICLIQRVLSPCTFTWQKFRKMILVSRFRLNWNVLSSEQREWTQMFVYKLQLALGFLECLQHNMTTAVRRIFRLVTENESLIISISDWNPIFWWNPTIRRSHLWSSIRWFKFNLTQPIFWVVYLGNKVPFTNLSHDEDSRYWIRHRPR